MLLLPIINSQIHYTHRSIFHLIYPLIEIAKRFLPLIYLHTLFGKDAILLTPVTMQIKHLQSNPSCIFVPIYRIHLQKSFAQCIIQ